MIGYTPFRPQRGGRLFAPCIVRRHSEECRLAFFTRWARRGDLDELGRFLDEAELRQGCDAVVETDFLDDFAILKLQHGRSRELHLPAGVGRQASDQKVIESRTGMRAASFPTTDDVVAFRDQVGGAPEVEIRKRLPEVGHEGLDVIATAAGFVQ
jgi:hypothetical protein